MAIAIAHPVAQSSYAKLDRSRDGRWDSHLFHLLVASGAATVIVGSYMTWATFYAGLVARNGVSGHGKFFIGLALAALFAALLPSIRGVWSGLRWLVVPAGIAIFAVAFRDLRNLDALVGDPAAGFYLPGEGRGLFVVLVGALIMIASPIARSVRSGNATNVMRTAAAALAVAAVAVLIPGLYGEYYLHFAAGGHAHDHGDVLNSAHVLTAGGVLIGAAALHLALLAALSIGSERAEFAV